MVYDDADFLPIWMRYWRARLEPESLYVFVHGGNEEMMDLAAGATRIPVARPMPHTGMERQRWYFLSAMVSGLTHMNDAVVYTDVDEILIADPDISGDPLKLIHDRDAPVSTAAGIELIHRSDLEPEPLDPSRPVLQQRRYVRASNYYCKPCIARQPVRWGRGGHFADQTALDFVPGLYNLHLRYMDDELFLNRAARRRETTATKLKINRTKRRAWRLSDAAAEEHLANHRDFAIAEETETAPSTFEVRRPMLRRAETVYDEGIPLYQFPFRESKTLQVLPERFRNLV